jgi:hypothetical protein
MPALLLHLPDGATKISLNPEGLVFGRDSGGCDVPLGSRLVSSRHATILQEQGRWILRDLGSLNGTFVGGERLQGERVLSASCVLQFADVIGEWTNEPLPVTPPTPPSCAPLSPELLARLRVGVRILRDSADSGVGAAQRVREATGQVEQLVRSADPAGSRRILTSMLEDGGSLSGTAEELELVFESFSLALDRFEALLAEADLPPKRS